MKCDYPKHLFGQYCYCQPLQNVIQNNLFEINSIVIFELCGTYILKRLD